MTLYCRIENGKIIEGPKSLPKNTKKISNLNFLESEELIKLGWFPVNDKIEDFDPNIQKLDKPTFRINKKSVTRTKKAIPLSEEEINNNKFNKIMNKIDIWSLLKILYDKGIIKSSDLDDEIVEYLNEKN